MTQEVLTPENSTIGFRPPLAWDQPFIYITYMYILERMIKTKMTKNKGEVQGKARIPKDGPRSSQEIHKAPKKAANSQQGRFKGCAKGTQNIHKATQRHPKGSPKEPSGALWEPRKPHIFQAMNF